MTITPMTCNPIKRADDDVKVHQPLPWCIMLELKQMRLDACRAQETSES